MLLQNWDTVSVGSYKTCVRNQNKNGNSLNTCRKVNLVDHCQFEFN